MSYIRFDRHSNMNVETLREIGNIINNAFIEASFDLTNMLYGLYDGYLYDDLLSVARKELSNTEYARVKKVVSVIKKNPKINP
jgi:hypothetical protein